MYILAVGSIIPYNGDFYKIKAINGDEVTLNNILDNSQQFKVSYGDLKQTIRSHNPTIKRSKSRSQSSKSSSKRRRVNVRGGKKSRKKSTLKRGK